MRLEQPGRAFDAFTRAGVVALDLCFIGSPSTLANLGMRPLARRVAFRQTAGQSLGRKMRRLGDGLMAAFKQATGETAGRARRLGRALKRGMNFLKPSP